MIEKAREKASEMITSDVRFRVVDFMDLSSLPADQFDVVLLTFDSINYLHNRNDILTLFGQVARVLDPEGIFIFDFTTPQNSHDALEILDGEEGFSGKYYYHRESEYNPEERIHTNIFTIQRLDNRYEQVLEQFREIHEQRIYTLSEMESIVEESSLNILFKYGDFDMQQASQDSLRVTMTLQCPQTP
jgi:ubiquinone/menaquinone biosynthesis C-methylase UbiE